MTNPIPRAAVIRLASVMMLVLCACRTSPDPRRFGPANSPTGITGSVRVAGGGEVVGELLAVTDTAYVMLVNSRVTMAPYAVLTTAHFAYVGRVTDSLGEAPSGKRRQRLELYSRFPFGIPGPAMSALLAKAGQSAADNARLTH